MVNEKSPKKKKEEVIIMKRKLLAILGVGILTFSLLAGCTNGDNGDNDVEDTNGAEEDVELSAEDVTLVVWESLEGPDEFIRQAGEAFTAIHPNITIDFQNVELGDSTTQIALDGPAGIGADVFAAPHDRLGELVVGGHILPVEDTGLVTSLALDSAVDAVTYEGTVFGYPVAAETYALFFNRDLVAEEDVPTSWEDLADFASTYDASPNAFIMDVGNVYYTILFTSADGNRLFGPEGTDTENTNINSEASIRGMEFFQSLREQIDIAGEDLDTSVADAAFSSGNAAMHISGPWNVAPFNEAGIDFGITTLPSLPGDDVPASSFSGARTMFVSAYSDHPAEATAFAEFLMSEEMQQLRYDITGALPATNIDIGDDQLQGFIDQLNYAYPMPSIPAMGAFWEAGNIASLNIWNGADVREELDAMNEVLMNAAE